jgi:tetratricopeptide (TPR) repeat protein
MSAPKKSQKRRAAAPAAPDRTLLWLYGGLLLVTLAAYFPAWHGAPLWDDDAHLTRVDLQSVAGLWRIWFDVGATQQYYPVAHSAFWLMHALWGDATLGYHLVNIVLHATSAWMLVVILRRLNIPGAILAGIIFALHPVHVESVAWMTELKNTLSGAFYLLAALFYLRFDAERKRFHYSAALVVFALALLTKSVTATLPAALLVVFWWQRGRLRRHEDVRPLLPFFGLAIVAGLFTAFVERTQVGAEGAAFQIPFLARCVIAGRAVWFYLAKLIWPVNLIFVYPRWTPDTAPALLVWPAAALLLGIVVWQVRRRTRAPLAAMLFFVGTLFPALGFVNVYPFKYSFVADHFQYLASIGVITLAAAGLTVLARRWASEPNALAGLALILGLPLGVMTFHQSAQYADAETLYRATLAKNPDAWLAHINLGYVYLRQQRFELAVAETREAIRLNPDLPQAQNNLGSAYLGLNQADQAVAAFRQARQLKPDDAEVRHNLALALQRSADAMQDRADIPGAIAAYQESLQLDPANPEAHHNLGSAFARLSRWPEAIAEFEATLRLNPSSERAARHLAQAKAQAGIK